MSRPVKCEMKERKQTSRDMRKQTEADIKYAYILARATRNMKTYHVVFCLNLTLAVCAFFRRLRARAGHSIQGRHRRLHHTC